MSSGVKQHTIEEVENHEHCHSYLSSTGRIIILALPLCVSPACCRDLIVAREFHRGFLMRSD
jgi:hypothetical protein